MATLALPVRDSSIAPLVRRPLESASCPLCHTAASSASAAFAWQCRTCGQHWTALRLETVAAYDAWSARRLSAIPKGESDRPTSIDSLPPFTGSDQAQASEMKQSEPVIHSDPEIMGGAPVFVGTRVPLGTLLDYLQAGQPLSEFLRRSVGA